MFVPAKLLGAGREFLRKRGEGERSKQGHWKREIERERDEKKSLQDLFI